MPRSSTASTPGLAKPRWRPIYDAVEKAARRLGKDVDVMPRKSRQVTFSRAKSFAVVRAASKDRIELALKLHGAKATPRLVARTRRQWRRTRRTSWHCRAVSDVDAGTGRLAPRGVRAGRIAMPRPKTSASSWAPASMAFARPAGRVRGLARPVSRRRERVHRVPRLRRHPGDRAKRPTTSSRASPRPGQPWLYKGKRCVVAMTHRPVSGGELGERAVAAGEPGPAPRGAMAPAAPVTCTWTAAPSFRAFLAAEPARRADGDPGAGAPPLAKGLPLFGGVTTAQPIRPRAEPFTLTKAHESSSFAIEPHRRKARPA